MEEKHFKIVCKVLRTLAKQEHPSDEDVFIFMEYYLKGKIVECLKGIPSFRKEDLPARCNEIYINLVEWFAESEQSGFSQLSNQDLFKKTNNKIYNDLRDKVTDFTFDDVAGSRTTYLGIQEGRDGLADIEDTDEIDAEDRKALRAWEQIEEETALPSFEEEVDYLADHGEPMPEPSISIATVEVEELIEELQEEPGELKEILEECSNNTIKEYLIKTFPSEEAFTYILEVSSKPKGEGDKLFMTSLIVCGAQKNFRRMEKELRAVWCYDSLLAGDSADTQFMKEVVNNYFAKYNSRATNQNIKRLAETQKKKMFKKFGRDKHSSEFTLNIKDAELLEQFKGFCFKYLRTRGTNQV